jgi:hypothetical protein
VPIRGNQYNRVLVGVRSYRAFHYISFTFLIFSTSPCCFAYGYCGAASPKRNGFFSPHLYLKSQHSPPHHQSSDRSTHHILLVSVNPPQEHVTITRGRDFMDTSCFIYRKYFRTHLNELSKDFRHANRKAPRLQAYWEIRWLNTCRTAAHAPCIRRLHEVWDQFTFPREICCAMKMLRSG